MQFLSRRRGVEYTIVSMVFFFFIGNSAVTINVICMFVAL